MGWRVTGPTTANRWNERLVAYPLYVCTLVGSWDLDQCTAWRSGASVSDVGFEDFWEVVEAASLLEVP